MSLYIGPDGHRAVIPANLTRSEVKRLRAAARGKRGTDRGRNTAPQPQTETTEQETEN